MGKVPSRGVDQFVVRFPDGLREQVREIAERNGRSMNAEIIARLEESIQAQPVAGDVTELKQALAHSERVIELQGEMIEVLSGEKEAVAKNAKLSEELALQFIVPIQLAAEGKTDALDRIFDRVKADPNALNKLIYLLSPQDEETTGVLEDFKEAIRDANKRQPGSVKQAAEGSEDD